MSKIEVPNYILQLALDGLGQAVLVVDPAGSILFSNRAARLALESLVFPLQIVEGTLIAREKDAAIALIEALARAGHKGTHRLLALPGREGDAIVSVRGIGPGLILLIFEKGRESLYATVSQFAMLYKLTPAETQVLEHLCRGLSPTQMSKQRSINVNTTRTQIASIKAKTGLDSNHALVSKVADVPAQVSLIPHAPSGGSADLGKTEHDD